MKYPVKLKRDTNGSLLVDFRDVPEAHTFGEDGGEALKRAVDALETALILCMEEKRDIPQPTHRGKIITKYCKKPNTLVYNCFMATRLGQIAVLAAVDLFVLRCLDERFCFGSWGQGVQSTRARPRLYPGGEARWMRGASVQGTRRLAARLLNEEAYLDPALSTASKRNEVMAGLSRASTVSPSEKCRLV